MNSNAFNHQGTKAPRDVNSVSRRWRGYMQMNAGEITEIICGHLRHLPLHSPFLSSWCLGALVVQSNFKAAA